MLIFLDQLWPDALDWELAQIFSTSDPTNFSVIVNMCLPRWSESELEMCEWHALLHCGDTFPGGPVGNVNPNLLWWLVYALFWIHYRGFEGPLYGRGTWGCLKCGFTPLGDVCHIFFDGCLQDCVTVIMKDNHNIPVYTAQSERKSYCAIRVKLLYWSLLDVHLICDLSGVGWWGSSAGLKFGGCRYIGIGWAHIMLCLCHGNIQCLIRQWGVIGYILIFQDSPKGNVASLDGIQPRWF